ncbi:MAG: hypothetical protein ACXWCY_28405 [Burkholderiales bacterium]
MNRFVIATVVGFMSISATAVYAQSRPATNTATPDQAGRAPPSAAAWQEGASNPDVSSKPLSSPTGDSNSNTGTGSTSRRSGSGSVASPDAAGRMPPSTAAGQEGAVNPDVSGTGRSGTR